MTNNVNDPSLINSEFRSVKNFPNYVVNSDGLIFSTKSKRFIKSNVKPEAPKRFLLTGEQGIKNLALYTILKNAFPEIYPESKKPIGECKELPNIPGYFIYRNGKIWTDNQAGGQFLIPSKLKTNKRGGGYLRVSLSVNGNKTMKLIHVLVATAFIPNPENKPEINHLDGDKENNNDWNLQWATRSENAKHAYRTGLIKIIPRYGEAGSATIPAIRLAQIREDLKDPTLNQLKIAIKYGVSTAQISRIKNGKTRTRD